MSPRRLFVTGLAGLLLAAPFGAHAHPPAKLSPEQEKGVVEEVQAFRKTVVDAIAAKEAKKLKALYADSYRHTHASGAVERKDTYVARLLNGQPAIETVRASDLEIRIPGGWTAIATGRSALPAADGKPQDVRWTVVYVRKGDSWQVAAGHATAISP